MAHPALRCSTVIRLLALIALLLSAAPARAGQPVVYVRASLATGANDGSSWADAYRGRLGLQAALTAAAEGSNTQIWIAAGAYAPAPANGGRGASFMLKSGVALYGGFAGNESLLAQRNPAANITILTGDLNSNGNDTGFSTENAAHVLRAEHVDTACIIDGLTITGGVATSFGQTNTVDVEHGGGMLIIGGSPRITNCRFISNSADWSGAGLLADSPIDLLVTNCTFSTNACPRFGGGAAVINDGAARFESCLFELNPGSLGGGIFAGSITNTPAPNCHVTIDDCTFRLNQGMVSSVSGGGVYARRCQATIRGCFFDRNRGSGGGGVFIDRAVARIDRCAFYANIANGDLGDALHVSDGGDAEVVSCAFWGHVQRPGISSDDAPIMNNRSTMRLINCTVASNGATVGAAGAIVSTGMASTTIDNCVLWNNVSIVGTGIGGAIRSLGGSITTVNNSCVQGWNGSLLGANNSAADPLFLSLAGADGITATPDDDLHLLPASPCIDAGDSTILPAYALLDLDGASRRRNTPLAPDTGIGPAPVVDRGAFEHQPPCIADFDLSGDVAVPDIFAFLSAWFTGSAAADIDGSPGVTVPDIFAFLSAWFAGCG